MVKKIYLETSNKDKIDHVLGKFLDHDCYDTLLTEDADVYEPLTPLQIANGETHSEKNILCKFRKNVFSKEMTDAAYEYLRNGAVMTDNRGLAAGIERDTAYQKMPDGQGGRLWVTEREKAIIEYVIAESPKDVDGNDQLENIYNKTPNKPLSNRGTGVDLWGTKERVKGGSCWLVDKITEFSFDDWYNKLKGMNKQQRKDAGLLIFHDFISGSTYANGVRSGVAGFFDRYPRIPFCRETGWTAQHKDKFVKAIPLFEAANEVYKKELPQRWQGQYEASLDLEEDWRIGKTNYTTVTINRDFRTAAHRDVGDLCESGDEVANPRGFSNLLVLDNGKKYDGFYLCFPEFRVAADIRAGDLIMMNAHRIHSNSPSFDYEEGFERMSVVLYFRDSMLECGTKKYEDARRNFVYMRRDDPNHPGHKGRNGWNGISPGMWDTEEWGLYLKNNGLHAEGDEVLNKLGLGEQTNTLESFF